jgi:two-component sensor histidine kinase
MGEPDWDGEAGDVETLKAALERERARSREIDHRTKNDLQLISSLMLMLSRRAQDPEVQRVLKSMHRRVSAIAATHRGFLGPDGFDLTAFIQDHATGLARSSADAEVTVRLDLDPCRTPANQAAALALLVNELTANALTHAFPDGRKGEIVVALRHQGAGFALTVEDDGCGHPPTPEQTGFGLTMVGLLARQLNATFALEDAQPGLRAVVTAA